MAEYVSPIKLKKDDIECHFNQRTFLFIP